jgi:hypothetical protein
VGDTSHLRKAPTSLSIELRLPKTPPASSITKEPSSLRGDKGSLGGEKRSPSASELASDARWSALATGGPSVKGRRSPVEKTYRVGMAAVLNPLNAEPAGYRAFV